MQIILAHDHFDVDHLETVKTAMQQLGAPTIKAVWMDCYNAWIALEGCHRIRAAAELGLMPEIEEIEWSDTITTDDVVPGSFDDTWTLEQVCDGANRREMIDFAD